MALTLCPLRLTKGKDADIRRGFPWVYAGEYIDSSELALLAPGSLVAIETHKGAFVGIGYYNARSQIACRVLSLKDEPVDEAFFYARFSQALAKREALFPGGYYRLAHSEADGLPGLTIDRFGEALSLQATTAGMDALMPLWMTALRSLLAPKTIVLRGDTAARKLEGLEQKISVVAGAADKLVELREYDTRFLADLLRGQKTGWFYDQRDNRKMIAGLAAGKTLLDVYSHSGGFGIPAAKAGARVTLIDSSNYALDIAKQAAALNNVACETIEEDAVRAMQRLAEKGERYDIVCADPPAFVKSKKDFAAGMKGYEKIAMHAAKLVEEGGLLFMASCSHHATRGAFNRAIINGVNKAGKQAEIVRQTGASPDHPRHPMLPQSEYLKGLLLKLS